MLVLGLSAEKTGHGKQLKDGAVCIIQDGDIVTAVAEERISRLKHAGGFRCSLSHALDWTDLTVDSFDAIVISSCCENVPPDQRTHGLRLVDPSRLSHIPSHHLSHAYSSFFASPFDQALIVVMDAGGNGLEHSDNSKWWATSREQNSYYIGEGKQVRLIGRDFDEPFEVGFGEAYRAFTYYLGWHSYTFSGNTMALAAYGDPSAYREWSLFEFDGQGLRSRMINNPPDPLGMVAELAESQGISIPKPRKPGHSLSQEYMDLASFIQKEFTNALVQKIRYLTELTGRRNLCIAGGVGLNCVANRKVLDETPIDRIFIQPASGDDGQALGNALYGYYHVLGQPRNITKFSPYLGRPYELTVEDLKITCPPSVFRGLDMREVKGISEKVAEMLSEGKVVAWFQGRSEYGPRALGNRSILADPRFPAIRERCHGIKKREFFRPFAPSVLAERASQFFDISCASPYMLLVAEARPDKAASISAVLHVDSTARLQTVSEDENPLFYDVIQEFERRTGVPIVLNTSLNRRGEPIVESPRDALGAFKELELDALAIGEVLVEKTPRASAPVLSLQREALEYEWLEFDKEDLLRRLRRDLPHIRLVGRSRMGFYSEHLKLLREGKASTTVRHRPDAVEYPVTARLPLLDTGSNGRCFQAYPVGEVLVKRLTIRKFGLLDDADARLTGVPHREDLCSMLQRIYGSITEHEFVTVYHVELCENPRRAV